MSKKKTKWIRAGGLQSGDIFIWEDEELEVEETTYDDSDYLWIHCTNGETIRMEDHDEVRIKNG